jgi:hypothetical protein
LIRQAHTYLVGALSGVVVIGIAIAAFVVLVSAQVFHDLPIPALSSSDQKAAAVSQGKALTGTPDRAVATTGGIGAGATGQSNPTPANGAGPTGQAGADNSGDGQPHQAAPPQEATRPAEIVEAAPTTTTTTPTPTTTTTGGHEGSSTGGDKTGGGNSSQTSSNQQPTSSPNSGGNSGGSSNSSAGTSGNSGSTSGSPTNTSGSSGGAPSTGTSGGGSTTTSPPATPVTTSKPSEAITETVNGAVGTVDEALGGALSEGGVTKVTEEVVNGAAGPESVVGKTVDGVGEVVGGLVGGSGQ